MTPDPKIPTPEEITPDMEAQAEAWDNAMNRAFKGIITRAERRRKMIRATRRQTRKQA